MKGSRTAPDVQEVRLMLAHQRDGKGRETYYHQKPGELFIYPDSNGRSCILGLRLEHPIGVYRPEVRTSTVLWAGQLGQVGLPLTEGVNCK